MSTERAEPELSTGEPRGAARSELYGFLSGLYADVDEDWVRSIRDESAREQLLAAAETLSDDVGWRSAFVALMDRIENLTAERLVAEHGRIFGLSEAGDSPPYETEYDSDNIFEKCQRLADICGFYQAFGLEVSEAAHERADHILVELEFMGCLVFKQLYAEARGRRDQAEICHDAQRRFLGSHLGRWAPTFAARLSKASGPDGFFRAAAELTRVFIAMECDRLAVPCGPANLRLTQTSPSSDDCSGCGVGSRPE